MNLKKKEDNNIISNNESSKDVHQSKPFRIRILGDLISSRREYLDMSLMCDKKLQWYERVTKQGKQLLSQWKFNGKMSRVSLNEAKLLDRLNQKFPHVTKGSQQNSFRRNQGNIGVSIEHNSNNACKQSKPFSPTKRTSEFEQGSIKNRMIDWKSISTVQGKAAQVPALSEEVGKIMENIQEARQSLPRGGKLLQIGGKRKLEKIDEKRSPANDCQENSPLPNENPSKGAIVKNGRLENDFRRLVLVSGLSRYSAADIKANYGTANTPTSGVTKRKWASKEAKALRNPSVVHDMLARSMILDPSSFQGAFWFPVGAMRRTNAEKDASAPNLNTIEECDSEPLPYAVLTPDGQIQPRSGRSLKKRRRDLRAAANRRVDSDSASSSVLAGTTPPSPVKFVIPDVPYDVAEALSKDVMDAAYDFIHNG